MKYSQGKVYKIQPIVEHEEGDIYIGSTCCKYLSQRLKAHRHHYKEWKKGRRGLTTSFNLFERYGVENCQILLLESVCCDDINELTSREAYHIRTLQCINKYIPLRSRKEYKEDNREKIAEQQKKYEQDNKGKITEYRQSRKENKCEYDKNYREVNRERILEQKKQYREKNKENIIEKARLKRQAKKNAENNLVV
jgi:hypothetical protein